MKNKQITKKNYNGLFLIPIIMAIAIIPLVVRLNIIPIDKDAFNVWTGQQDNVDFFSYSKSILIIISALVVIILLCINKFNAPLKIKPLYIYYIPIFLYAIFSIVSAILSKQPNTAKFGFVDRYEGIYVLLAYLIFLFISINFFDNEKHTRILFIALVGSAIIVGTIGIFQFFGADFFRSTLGKTLIIPYKYKSVTDTIAFTFGKHTIYSTLYNTNYVGSYMAMLFPFTFCMFILAKSNKIRILYGVISCLMFVNLVGCRSRAGLVGVVASLLVLVIILRKNIITSYKQVLIAGISFLLIFIGLNAISGGDLIGRLTIDKVFSSSTNDNSNIEGENEVSKNESVSKDIEDIIFSNKKVSIVTLGNILNLNIEGNQVLFFDKDNNQIKVNKNEKGYLTFDDKNYSAYQIEVDSEKNILVLHYTDKSVAFFIQSDGFQIIGERGILLKDIERPESAIFTGYEKLASSRGYIWSRSIPLLKKFIFVGAGPDAFAFEFPQHDYVGKLKAFGTVNQIVDKPHDLYLQIGINTGVISLICILVLFVIYFLSSCKIYIKSRYKEEQEKYGAALFVAFIGYAVAGIFNDSLVSVAPVFWVLFGLGIMYNYKIRMNQKRINEQ